MPISFGNNVPSHPGSSLISHAHARLIDIRSAEAFQAGFIPGSYNVPDLACTLAAHRSGLFVGREIYVIADHTEQLRAFLQALDDQNSDGFRSPGLEYPDFQGWFGADSIGEWQRAKSGLGFVELLDADELKHHMAEGSILILDVQDRDESRSLSHPSALRFEVDELPLALEGLPVESALCITASSSSLGSFAASLLWNFGFHQLSFFTGGCVIDY